MFLSFIPWLAFSVLAARHGADSAVAACRVAAGLSLVFAVRDGKDSNLKPIDVLGVVLSGAMAAVSTVGDGSEEKKVIDYGRGAAALVPGARHPLVGYLEPAADPAAGAQPVDLT